jgi:hypothetical protein
MRAAIVGVATAILMASAVAGHATPPMTPGEIQSTFFTGQAFTASTPSNVKFKMTFSADGKVTREPVGKGGAKGEGSWKLTNDGFCTKWRGGGANCFAVRPSGPNKWAVLKGAAVVAIWTK